MIKGRIILIIIINFCSIFVFSQQKCEVLKADISGTYSGDCKKGLAHGNGVSKGLNQYEGEFKKGLPNGVGTIIYADGSSYYGDWKNGERYGEGIYKLKVNGKDSIADGLWKNDAYIGKKPVKQFEVIKQISVSRYTIRKIGDIKNQVTIKVRQNGQALRNTFNNINTNSGNRVNYEGYIVFESINYYPFNCDLRYSVPSKMGAASVDVEFFFKILVEGEWLVEINH